VAKDVVFYKGKYYQGGLTSDRAEALLSLITEYDSVASLRHVIKNAPEHIITDIKNDAEAYQKEHKSLAGFKHDYEDDLGVGTLRDAQTIGVAFMYYAESALLGDEVGLGKTVQIAGLCNVLAKEFANSGREFRYIFLTEKSSAGQIRDKMIQFTGEYVELLESGEKDVISAYIAQHGTKKQCSFVGSHSIMNSSEFLTHTAKHPFDLIIVDESSIAKNASSEFYINCKALFKFHTRKILLNATPVEIQIREMYNQLNLLDPDYMPTVTEFNNRYTKTKRTPFGYAPDGYKNTEEFRDAISLRYISRTRADLGAKYTENMYKTILIPHSPEQKALSKKTTLHQMVNDYPTGVDRSIPYNEATTPKLAVTFKILEEAVGVFRNQVLIYCKWIDAQEKMKELLLEKGYRVVVLNGQSKTKERAECVRDFNNGQYDIMITNVLRGIDLKTCDNCILYTIDPNPQKMVQFEGRMTRDLDIMYKSVYLLVAMGKEKKLVEDKLKIRVGASDAVTNTGKSMVLSAIKSDENKEMYDSGLQFEPDDDE
jgi:SNF2 family DNA or RNA helicase